MTQTTKNLKKRMSIVLTILLCTILSSAIVIGLSCTSSPSPQYGVANKIQWHCVTNENTTCFTKVTFEDELIQASPYPAFNDDNEIIEGFECNDLCVVEFDNTDLRNARNVTFAVVCGDDTITEDNVRPDLNSPLTSEVAFDRFVWVKDNIAYIFGIILLAIILFFIIGFGWRKINK